MLNRVAHMLVLLSVTAGSVACGGGSGVPIADIPPEKRLLDLDSHEKQGVCEWSAQLANMKLPKAGTMLNCHGLPITFNGPSDCMFPTPAQPGCTATVGQYRACIPNILDRIAADPCLVIDVAFSGNVNSFIEQTPGCQGLGPCGFVVRMM